MLNPESTHPCDSTILFYQDISKCMHLRCSAFYHACCFPHMDGCTSQMDVLCKCKYIEMIFFFFFLTKSSLETCGYRIYVPMKRVITNTVKSSSCYSFNSFSQGQVSSTLFLFKPFFSINCLALFRYFGQVSVVYLNHFFQ